MKKPSESQITNLKSQIFILVITFSLALIITGCSLTQSNITGPSSIDDQLYEKTNEEDMREISGDFEKQVQKDIEEINDDIVANDKREAFDDFEKQVQKDIEEFNDKIESGNMRDVFDDFEKQIQDKLDKLNDKMESDEMRDVFDDFEKQIQDNLDELNDKIEANDTYDKFNDSDEDIEIHIPEVRRDGPFVAVSCDSIQKMSTCVDYIGSFWTQRQMGYACEYSGELSDEPCESGSIGGCQVGKGGFNDMIIWMYPFGGSPISGDNVEAAQPACDMNPMGNWVSGR